MAASFEICFHPDPHEIQGIVLRHHALPQCNHIRIIMLASQGRAFTVPTQCTPNSFDPIRTHSLTVSGTSQDYSPFTFAARNGQSRWVYEDRVVNRFIAVRAEIDNMVTEIRKQPFDGLLIFKTGMIRGDGNFHFLSGCCFVEATLWRLHNRKLIYKTEH